MLIDRLLLSDPIGSILKKGLDFQSARHLLISSNISNVDTPGYKAHDVDFEKQLQEALGGNRRIRLRKTHESHFNPGPNEVKSLEPRPFQEGDPAKSNGNNVSIDKEMAKLAENQILYNALSQIMMKRGSTVRSAVTELAQR